MFHRTYESTYGILVAEDDQSLNVSLKINYIVYKRPQCVPRSRVAGCQVPYGIPGRVFFFYSCENVMNTKKCAKYHRSGPFRATDVQNPWMFENGPKLCLSWKKSVSDRQLTLPCQIWKITKNQTSRYWICHLNLSKERIIARWIVGKCWRRLWDVLAKISVELLCWHTPVSFPTYPWHICTDASKRLCPYMCT